jgi:dolichol-phosphate mannosyltransferase
MPLYEHRTMISVVIPCYNETEVLRLTYRTLVDAAKSWGDSFELVLVDDGSRDDTWDIIESLAAADVRVRGVRLSRNFGHQAAMGAGLEHAQGDVVVVLDADLQDPPSLVGQMLDLWRQGYDVVVGQRNRRHGESLFKRVSASLFYRLLGWLTSNSIPRDTGDFCLMDRRVVQTLVAFREHHLFWRGLRAWSGFRHTAIEFDRPQRAAGETKYTLRKMLALASNGLLAFSDLPLRLPMYAGAISLALTVAAALLSLVAWLIGPSAAAWGIPPATLALFFLGSVQLLSVGIVGEYLCRIYHEVRNRPRWIVSQRVNAGDAAAVRPETLRKAG